MPWEGLMQQTDIGVEWKLDNNHGPVLEQLDK